MILPDKGGTIALTSDIPAVPTLAPVATSGSYNDLTDKPKIPTNYVPYTTVADKPYVDIGNYYGSGAERGFTSRNMLNSTYNTYTLPGDKSGVIALTSDIPTLPTLATVATTGSYNDLTDKPTIPDTTNFVTTDTAQTITGVKTFAHKPDNLRDAGIKIDMYNPAMEMAGVVFITDGNESPLNWCLSAFNKELRIRQIASAGDFGISSRGIIPYNINSANLGTSSDR